MRKMIKSGNLSKTIYKRKERKNKYIKKNMQQLKKIIFQMLQYCIAPTIRIVREIQCLLYAGFLKVSLDICTLCQILPDKGWQIPSPAAPFYSPG